MTMIDANGLRALANERRLEILAIVGRGEHGVGEIQRLIGIDQSAVSQHLARLRAVGMVERRRDGQTIYYRLNRPRLAAVIAGLRRLLKEPSQSANAFRSVPRGAAGASRRGPSPAAE